MAERLGEALLELRTDDVHANKGIDRTEKNTRRLGTTFDKVGLKALKLGRNLALAAAAAGTALGLMVKRTIDHADAMSKAARRAGVMTEALSELAWAGELSDVSLDKITTGLQRLSYNMGQAATGADKTLAAAFRQLGIDIKNTDGTLRDADAVLLDIAEKFGAMESGADKTALAMRIFGRAGGEMITLLDNGKDGLREMADEAHLLGLVISTEMGQRAEVLNDTLTRVRKGFEGIVVRIANDMLPQLQAFADWLNDPAVVQGAETMARGVVEALGWITDAVREVVGWLQTMGEWWGKMKGLAEWASTHDMFGNALPERQQNAVAAALERERNKPDPLSDDAFKDRFTPPLTGKTGRLPAKTQKPSGDPFKFSDLTTGTASSGKSAKEEYQELTASAQQYIDMQRIEQQALSLTEQAANALRYEQELLNEAKRADIALTPQQESELKGLAQQMAEAEASTRVLADNLEFRRDTFRGFFSELKGGLQNGKTFWESFRDAGLNALDKITDRIFNQMLGALDQLGNSLTGLGSGGGGGGGFLGGIGQVVGSLFSGFFADGGMIPAGSFGIVGEKGPEPVFGTSSGAAVLPNSALSSMSGGTSSVKLYVIGEEGKFFAPKIRAEAQGVAVQVVREGIGQYDDGLAGRISDVMERNG
ncbi:MAG: hypothetical protein P1V13_22135 [Rhizobiaceae bacterium]|nr:hypothetical protein [Rhizobiaceae bacterium]